MSSDSVAAGHAASFARWVLGALLAFGALNALAGGYYGLAGAKGVPLEWLAGSPFTDDVVPSLFLLVVVGGSLALAAVAVAGAWPSAQRLSKCAAIIVILWVAVQVTIIGYVSWMQPATSLAGVAILALSRWLRT